MKLENIVQNNKDSKLDEKLIDDMELLDHDLNILQDHCINTTGPLDLECNEGGGFKHGE